jgi:hypothetical protein
MVNYKDLGLVNTREMFAKAIKGGYAIPAFNFNNMEQMQAIILFAYIHFITPSFQLQTDQILQHTCNQPAPTHVCYRPNWQLI